MAPTTDGTARTLRKKSNGMYANIKRHTKPQFAPEEVNVKNENDSDDSDLPLPFKSLPVRSKNPMTVKAEAHDTASTRKRSNSAISISSSGTEVDEYTGWGKSLTPYTNQEPSSHSARAKRARRGRHTKAKNDSLEEDILEVHIPMEWTGLNEDWFVIRPKKAPTGPEIRDQGW